MTYRAWTLRTLTALLITLCVLGTAPPLVVRAQTAPAPVGTPAPTLPSPGAESALSAPPPAPAAPSATAVLTAATVLQEAWDLLLDRFMDPLEPATLAQAANDRMVEMLREKGTAPDEGPLDVEAGRAAAWASLVARYRALATRYPGVEPTDLVHAAIEAMADAADDTHTNFMSPRQYRDHLAWARGEVRYEGVGARLRGPELTIVEVFSGSPAAAGGLRPGDRILEVDGTSTEGLRVEEAVTLVRGPEGTPVTLTIQRPGGAQAQPITLHRAAIQVPFVESRRVGDHGYVRLRGFPEPSVIDAVERAILTFQGEGVQGIVLDLRGNGGGRLDVGTRLLSRFVPSGPIYQEVDRRGRQATRNVRATGMILTVPLAVLIDEGTASMGEVFAINVQEHQVGRLFGTATRGSVAASQVLPLSDGSALQLSVMQIFSGQGQRLNRVGVRPDEEIELSLADLLGGRDVQLERALAYLREAAQPPRPGATRSR